MGLHEERRNPCIARRRNWRLWDAACSRRHEERNQRASYVLSRREKGLGEAVPLGLLDRRRSLGVKTAVPARESALPCAAFLVVPKKRKELLHGVPQVAAEIAVPRGFYESGCVAALKKEKARSGASSLVFLVKGKAFGSYSGGRIGLEGGCVSVKAAAALTLDRGFQQQLWMGGHGETGVASCAISLIGD